MIAFMWEKTGKWYVSRTPGAILISLGLFSVYACRPYMVPITRQAIALLIDELKKHAVTQAEKA